MLYNYNCLMNQEELEEIFRRNRLLDEYQQQRAIAFWSDVVGIPVAQYTNPERIAGGTLHVRVSSAAAAHELSMLVDQHRARLNHLMGRTAVRRIHYTVGPLPTSDRPIPLVVYCGPEQAIEEFGDLDDERLARGFARIYAAQQNRAASLLAAGGVQCPRCGVVHRSEAIECPGCRYERGED